MPGPAIAIGRGLGPGRRERELAMQGGVAASGESGGRAAIWLAGGCALGHPGAMRIALALPAGVASLA